MNKEIANEKNMKLVSTRLREVDQSAIAIVAELEHLSKSKAIRLLIQYGILYYNDINLKQDSPIE